MGGTVKRAGSALALFVLVLVGLPVGAHAAAIENGRIYYSNGAILPDPDPSSESQIWSVKPDGTGIRQLTHVVAPVQAGGPDVSPDGTKVLYVSNPHGPFQVWMMDADGSGQHRVVKDAGHDAFVPRWSPDGTQLLFTRCSFPFGFLECTIATAAVDGTGLRDLTSGHWFDFSAAYSPDGNTVAFAGDRGGFVSAIFRIPAAGGQPHRVTPADIEAFAPDYRPDGRRILFGNNADRPHTDFFTMTPSGGNVMQLTEFAPGTQGGFARYSPDGKRIVFDYVDDTTDWLAVMNTDGSGFTKLVEVGGTETLTLADWGVSS